MTWEAMQDTAGGQTHVWNTITNTATWKLPLPTFPPPQVGRAYRSSYLTSTLLSGLMSDVD